MSSINLSSLLSSQLQSIRSASQTAKPTSAATAPTNATSTSDFSSTLALRMAEFKSQSVSTLLDSGKGGDEQSVFNLISTRPETASSGSDIASLLGASTSSAVASVASPVSTSGYKLSLADPAAAYNMMSFINASEVNFKAQFAELSEMGSAIKTLQPSADALGRIDAASDPALISAQLKAIADDYNAWVTRFDDSVEGNGVLSKVRAAEIAYQQLEISVENRFNGATSGVHGLSDLGLTVDESSTRVVLDSAALTSALAANKSGVIATLKEFSASFSESARLLTSQGNFIDNRLDNLDRAIDYLADNKASLQSEFGTGAGAEPSERVAAALATYNRVYAG